MMPSIGSERSVSMQTPTTTMRASRGAPSNTCCSRPGIPTHSKISAGLSAGSNACNDGHACACRSEPQMPEASVLTSTCSMPGLGSGSVSTTISPFLKMVAPVGVLPAVRDFPLSYHGGLPHVTRDALACVGFRNAGELPFEDGGEREAVQPFHLGCGRGQRGIVRLRRAVDDEGRARQRLEHRRDIAVGVEIMRPGGAAAQSEDRVLQRERSVGANAELRSRSEEHTSELQ